MAELGYVEVKNFEDRVPGQPRSHCLKLPPIWFAVNVNAYFRDSAGGSCRCQQGHDQHSCRWD